MPLLKKLINDYTFYKIVNINGDVSLCYVGSTVNMKERVRTHRHACNTENLPAYNGKVYQTIREHGGWGEFKMVPIGTAKQLTLTQARILEEEYRVELKAELNTYRCCGNDECSRKQTNITNKKWRDNNKEKVAQMGKAKYEKNKEVINKKNREYYQKNKTIINKQQKEGVTCLCGCIVQKSGFSKHKKTQKHIDLIENLVTKNK